MNNVVYPCHGSLDDWAYGSSWDNTIDSKTEYCEPDSYQPYINEEYFANTDHFKTSLILVEASENKQPPNSEYGNKKNITCKDCGSEGYINRHLRLCLSYIDLIQPYPVIEYPTFDKEAKEIRIRWKLNG